MRQNFNKLEAVRESLPSKAKMVLAECGEDIMRTSYLKDLELYNNLTNI